MRAEQPEIPSGRASLRHPGDAAIEQPVEQQVVFTPPIDIFERPDGLILLADLPGVTLETLELQVQDNRLTLYGRVQTQWLEGVQTLHQEYPIGHFLRSFILNDEVDHEKITARLAHGVLEVFLPPRDEGHPQEDRSQNRLILIPKINGASRVDYACLLRRVEEVARLRATCGPEANEVWLA